jgi:hypothetical protein
MARDIRRGALRPFEYFWLFSQYLQWVGTMNATKREYRISNKECRMLKLLGQRKNVIIRNSLFDIRYSFSAHGKFIIHKLPTAEGLPKHLRFFESGSPQC